MEVKDLKQVAIEMKSSIVAFGVKHRARSELRSIVIARMRDLRHLGDDECRFVGDHVMALYGYGAGL